MLRPHTYFGITGFLICLFTCSLGYAQQPVQVAPTAQESGMEQNKLTAEQREARRKAQAERGNQAQAPASTVSPMAPSPGTTLKSTDGRVATQPDSKPVATSLIDAQPKAVPQTDKAPDAGLNSLEAEKKAYMLAHPEVYKDVAPDNGQAVSTKQGAEATMLVNQTEFNASSKEKQAFMQAHPEQYKIVSDQQLSDPASAKAPITQMSQEEFDNLSQEKRNYVLAHPFDYEIVNVTVIEKK